MAERTFTAGNFTADIDGVSCGYLKKFSGLGMVADIAENQLGPDNVIKKHVAKIKWEAGKISVGIGMGNTLYKWIKAAFDKGVVTKSGTIMAADFDHKCKSVMDFQGALITEVTVPKLSGDDKNAAYFDIAFQPEQVRWSPGTNADIRAKMGPKQKAWLCSNWKIEIGDLPCTRVASIDSFTWKCSTVFDDVGMFRESTVHPAKVTVPDLKLAISYADHPMWAKKAKDWFIDGKHLESDEMNGRIVFLGPDMKEELGEIELKHVGLKSFKEEDSEGGSDKVKRFNVELYVEQMAFKLSQYDQ